MAEKSKPGKEKEAGKAGSKQEEKVLIVPLRNKARRSAKNKRMNRSVREIKLFLAKHMGAELSNVSVSQQLNEFLWKGGYHNPPSSIRVKVSSDEEGKVLARLVDEKERPKKERKSRLGLRERLARRKEGKEEPKNPEPKAEQKPIEKKQETKPASKPDEKDSGEKAEQKKEGDSSPSKEHPPSVEESKPSEEIDQGMLLEE